MSVNVGKCRKKDWYNFDYSEYKCYNGVVLHQNEVVVEGGIKLVRSEFERT